MLSSDHLFSLRELLDPLHQRGKIMDPEGRSLALSEGRSETMRRFFGVIWSPDSAGFS